MQDAQEIVYTGIVRAASGTCVPPAISAGLRFAILVFYGFRVL